MDKVFLTILNMSFTGMFVIAAICIARLALKKAPGIISYCLWAVAGVRLLFPISIKSVFSLIPVKAQVIPTDITTHAVPRIDSGLTFINNAIGSVLPSSNMAVENPLRFWTSVSSWLWLTGAVVLLLIGVVFYFRLKSRMDSAIRVEGDLYETDGIQSPFVLGVLKPKIYIPLDLSGQEREFIILHERTHIRRFDHIIKFVAYLILCLHWFNPMAWVAFRLMGLDMEMSCDELVMKNLGSEIKRNYSMSLLSIAADRRVLKSSPLAFGENGVEKRVKNVLKFKRPSRFAFALVIPLVILLSLGLAMSRSDVGGLYDFGGSNAKNTYVITDYYNSGDGRFSALGLTLAEEGYERVLTVSRGDILVAGDRRYEVTAESLTLVFYTQPSPDRVVQWWIYYLDSWAESGKVAVNA